VCWLYGLLEFIAGSQHGIASRGGHCWPAGLLACWPAGLLACWPGPEELVGLSGLLEYYPVILQTDQSTVMASSTRLDRRHSLTQLIQMSSLSTDDPAAGSTANPTDGSAANPTDGSAANPATGLTANPAAGLIANPVAGSTANPTVGSTASPAA